MPDTFLFHSSDKLKSLPRFKTKQMLIYNVVNHHQETMQGIQLHKKLIN